MTASRVPGLGDEQDIREVVEVSELFEGVVKSDGFQSTEVKVTAAGANGMSKKPIKTVLLIEDNAGDARLLREILNEQGSEITELAHVQCMIDAEKYLAEHTVDIILLDLGLPDAQGLEAVQRAHAAAPRVPVVVLTGMDDESLATLALQEGAQDY